MSLFRYQMSYTSSCLFHVILQTNIFIHKLIFSQIRQAMVGLRWKWIVSYKCLTNWIEIHKPAVWCNNQHEALLVFHVWTSQPRDDCYHLLYYSLAGTVDAFSSFKLQRSLPGKCSGTSNSDPDARASRGLHGNSASRPHAQVARMAKTKEANAFVELPATDPCQAWGGVGRKGSKGMAGRSEDDGERRRWALSDGNPLCRKIKQATQGALINISCGLCHTPCEQTIASSPNVSRDDKQILSLIEILQIKSILLIFKTALSHRLWAYVSLKWFLCFHVLQKSSGCCLKLRPQPIWPKLETFGSNYEDALFELHGVLCWTFDVVGP